MNKDTRFRILKKTSKEVTIKLGDQIVTTPWEEFNATFNVVDKYWAVPNEEMKKQSEELDTYLSLALIATLDMHNAKAKGDAESELIAAGKLGHLVTEIQKKFGLTPAQVIQILRQNMMALNPHMMNPMFSDEQMKEAGRYKKRKNRRRHKQEEPVPVVERTPDPDKPTIGDACPGLYALREKLENGE